MNNQGGNTVPRITQAEHIGPNDTGDNIEAKRVANYAWNPTTSDWERYVPSAPGPVGQYGVSYDTIEYTNTSTTVDTYVYKTGGTGGTVTATVAITYTNTTKSQVSSVVRT